jgi:hypothetical protein
MSIAVVTTDDNASRRGGGTVEETVDVVDVPPQVVAAMQARASAVDVDALTNRHWSWHPQIPT